MEKATYKVHGMTCGGCVKSVEAALQRELGDVHVDVDLEHGTVQLDPTVDVDRVRKAITGAGFDFETN